MYSSVRLERSSCLQLQRLLNTYTVAPDTLHNSVRYLALDLKNGSQYLWGTAYWHPQDGYGMLR